MIRTLLLLSFVFTSVISCFAQQHTEEVFIDEVIHHVPLNKVLKDIQRRYDIKIAYASKLVENIFIDAVVRHATVDEFFKQLLQNTSLESIAEGRNVIIVPHAADIAAPTRFNFAVAGVVVDDKTGETLPNVYITVQGTNMGSATNRDGYFSILQVPTDTAVINIRYLGYSSQCIPMRKVVDLLHLKIKLRDETKILQTVLVSDEYNQALQIDNETSKIAFNPKTLRSLPSLGEQDVFRTMQLMPGVGATDESSAGMNIRGMHASENLILLDGITIYQLDHFFGAFSILNSDIIKDVRVYRGIFDAKYGGRVSGVVDITAKNGNVVKPSFKVGSNFISVRATAEIPISSRFSLLVAGRRSYTDMIQGSLFQKLYEVGKRTTDQIRTFSNSQFNYLKPFYFFYDVNAKLSYKPSQRDIISLSLYNSADQLLINDTIARASSLRPHEYTNWGNAGASTRWGRQWNKKFYTNVRLSGSRFLRDYEFSNAYVSKVAGDSTIVNVTNNVTDLSLAIESEWLVNDRVSCEIGFSSSGQRINDEVQNRMIAFHMKGIGSGSSRVAYGTVHAKLTNTFNISFGVRLNNYGVNDSLSHILFSNNLLRTKLYVEPRINLRYFITPTVQLKAAYGKNNQLISQVIINEHTGAPFDINNNFWVLSNDLKGVPVIASNHYTIGATLNASGFIFDYEFYYKRSNGIIDNKLIDGKSISMGMDIMMQKTVGLYKGWIGYSLSSATESFLSFEQGKFFSTLYDQRHELKIVNMFTLGVWNLSTTWIYGSGRPYPTYTVNYGNGTYELVRDYGNTSRLPAYHRLDLAISYKFKMGKYLSIETGLSIFNAYNAKNIKTRKIDIVTVERNIAANRLDPPSYLDIKLMDFTPNLFLNITL